ncbi:ABC transporter permease [Mahella australiensis]|nr:ABC transporter permease subunit [Mahella australiensis]
MSFVTLSKQWQLYLMVSLPIVYILIFCYVPMGGIIIAFKDFSMRRGIWGSEWVGLKYFHQFLATPLFSQLLSNTILLSLYSLVAGFFMPIILALALNEVQNVFFKKTVQMVTYFPYFISTVVMVGIVLQILSPQGGLVNNVIELLGGERVNFMGEPKLWRHIYVWSGVWQNTGYSAIIYIAALSGVDSEQIEAAVIDGVSRIQRVWYIDLPAIAPTATIMLILGIGGIMNVGFEKVYLMQNPLNLDVSEVISTFVYKKGLINYQYSYATAVGLFNSVVNFILILGANTMARHIGETSLW